VSVKVFDGIVNDRRYRKAENGVTRRSRWRRSSGEIESEKEQEVENDRVWTYKAPSKSSCTL
jgi:hypothetical protein